MFTKWWLSEPSNQAKKYHREGPDIYAHLERWGLLRIGRR